MKTLTLLSPFLILGIGWLSAAPTISEFMSANDTTIADEDGEFEDWIEIHNPDQTPLNLDGYYLTDNAANLKKWRIPPVTLEADGYLVIFASNKGRDVPGAELHTNFQLDSKGEYLALVMPDGVTVLRQFSPVFPQQYDDQSYGAGSFGNVVLEDAVAEEDIAKYFVPTDGSLGTTWKDLAFNDAAWQSGSGGFGWESLGGTLEPGIRTDLRDVMWGINAGGYFRYHFNHDDTNRQVVSLLFSAFSDDGFAAFLNGVEVGSFNSPDPLAWDSKATGSRRDPTALSTPVEIDLANHTGLIQNGENVLAIRGMNTSPGGSDFLISPVLTMGILDTSGQELQGYFNSPTPGNPNSSGVPSGPIFVDYTKNPARPAADADLLITAEVSGVDAEVTELQMFYRIMLESEKTLTMNDAGTSGDETADDGIFSALIPANDYGDGDMIRWRFEATDAIGVMSKEPQFVDPRDSHEYVGTVALDPAVQTKLPVIERFLTRTTSSRGAVFYLGELYDNVGFSIHGQSTSGFPKKSYNIDFNKSQRFRWSPDAPRVKDIDLLTNWADKSKVRHVFSWEIMRESGVHGHFAHTVRVQQNGEFFSTADMVEDADEVYLKRAGLNPDGVLYKIYNNTLSGGTGGVEKKTRKHENNSDMADFVTGLRLSGSALLDFTYDNVNIPMCVNMCAANCIVRNTDMHRKNWYLYRDTGRTDEWAILPWDLDLAHGRKWNSTDTYFDNKLHTSGTIQVGTAVKLVSQLFGNPDTREMIYRRIRTLSDKFLQHPDTPMEKRWFERRLDEQLDLINPTDITPSDARQDYVKWGSWIQSQGSQRPYTFEHNDMEDMAKGIERFRNEYLPDRRNEIYNRQRQIPEPQTGAVRLEFLPLVVTGAACNYQVPVDGSEGVNWTTSNFNDGTWASATTGVGYDRGSDYDPLLGVDTEDIMSGINGSVYVRIPFEIADPSIFQALELHMKYDDGFVAYLNGVRIAADRAPAPIEWNSTATGSHESDTEEFDIFDVSGFANQLQAGTNVLSIHGMNTSIGSSDFIVLPELHGGVSQDQGASAEPFIDFGRIDFHPESGNQDEEFIELINNQEIWVDVSDWKIEGAIEFSIPPGTVIPPGKSLFLSPDIPTFRARAVSPKGGEQNFVVGKYKGHLSNFGEEIILRDISGVVNNQTSYVGNPSDPQKYIVISELMYHPSGDGQAEFLELLNISNTVTVDLTGITMGSAADFDFTGSGVTRLAPGQRALIVRNAAAFNAAYGAGLPVAGVFANDTALGNGGETIKLEDAESGTIQEFRYDDAFPWPVSPDGDGYSLVLIDPLAKPDHSAPENWRASASTGGTPGSEEQGGPGFVGNPNADGDGDGLSALLEYALGTSDANPQAGLGAYSSSSGSFDNGQGSSDTYATFTYQKSQSAAHVTFTVEVSNNLEDWQAADVVAVSRADNGNGTASVTVRSAQVLTSELKKFFRLKVALQ